MLFQIQTTSNHAIACCSHLLHQQKWLFHHCTSSMAKRRTAHHTTPYVVPGPSRSRISARSVPPLQVCCILTHHQCNACLYSGHLHLHVRRTPECHQCVQDCISYGCHMHVHQAKVTQLSTHCKSAEAYSYLPTPTSNLYSYILGNQLHTRQLPLLQLSRVRWTPAGH